MATRRNSGQKIESRDALDAWLKGKPREVALAIAVRAALRVVPLTAGGDSAAKLDAPLRARLLLSACRAILVCWVATGGNATQHTRAAARAAARAADAFAADAFAAVAAFAAARAADAFAAVAARAAARAADADPAAVWAAVAADCRQFDAGAAVAAVLRLPLWHGQTPDWARRAWREVTESADLAAAGFAPWLRWCEGLAAFDAAAGRDFFGPDLARRIALQPDDWWERGVEAVNADIAEWLAPQLAAAMGQAPAEYKFEPRDGQVDVAPPAPEPLNPRMAEALLAGLRDKAKSLRQRLAQNNAVDPRAATALENLLAALPDQAATLEPGRLLVTGRSVETLLGAFTDGNEADALFPGAVAEIADVVESLGDLKACYPEIREIERERRAQQVQRIGVDKAVRAAEALADSANQAGETVTPPAQEALRKVAEEAKNAVSPKLMEELAGHALAVGQNFIRGATKLAARVVEETADVSAKSWKSAKPKVIRGVSFAIIAKLAYLLAMIDPLIGAAFFLGANGQEKMLIETFKRIFDRVLKNKTDPAPESPEQAKPEIDEN